LDGLQLEPDEWHSLRYAVSELSRYKEVPIFRHLRTAIERIDCAFELGLGIEDNTIEKIVQFETGNSTTEYRTYSSSPYSKQPGPLNEVVPGCFLSIYE
jgi:hypothetical protein